MATKNMYTTLLGYDPREQQLQQQKLWSGLYGAASSPYEKIGLGLGQIGGALFGQLTEDENKNPVKQLEKLTTEASAQFSPNSPEYYNYIASNTNDPTIKANASQLAAETEATRNKTMREDVTYYTTNPQQATQELQTLAARIEANPNDLAALRKYESIAQAMQVGTREDYNKAEKSDLDITSKKQQIQKTGLEIKKLRDEMTPGELKNVKTSDLASFTRDIRAEVGDSKEKLGTLSELQTLLKDVTKNNNVQSYNLFMSSLAKAAGDNKVSEKEVARLTGGGSLITRGVSGISTALTGLPTDAKLAEIKKTLDLLEKETAEKYNSKAEALKSTWKDNIPDRILGNQLPYGETTKEKEDRKKNEKNTMGTKAFDAEMAKLPPRPAGIDPMTWKFMTPEERKLF